MTRTPLTDVHIRIKEGARLFDDEKPLHAQIVETGDAVRLYVPATDGSGTYGDVDLIGLLRAVKRDFPKVFVRARSDADG